MYPNQMTAARGAAVASAITLLKADHDKVNGLFQEFKAAAANDEKAHLAREICTELIIHMVLEEEVFYPACRDAQVDGGVLDEAQIEHDTAKILIGGLLRHEPDSPYFEARMAVLAEYVRHHIAEEEKSGCGIFARAKAAHVDTDALGQRLRQRRKALMVQISKDGPIAPMPRSLDLDLVFHFYQEHMAMAREDRFMDEDAADRHRHPNRSDSRANRGPHNGNGRDDDEGKQPRRSRTQGGESRERPFRDTERGERGRPYPR